MRRQMVTTMYNNTIYFLLGWYHVSVNWISIVFMQLTPRGILPEMLGGGVWQAS